MATTKRIGEGLTFEKVWAALMENREQLKENAERQKETDRQMKETDKRIGDLAKRFGESVEYLAAPNLANKFKKLGFVFEKTHQNTKIRNQEGQIIAEIDTFLENGDKAMAVESKVKPSIDDVNDHVKRMEKLREYADRRHDTRKYLGAIAGVVFGNNVKTYALSRGFYVLEPSGDTFVIIEPKGEYHPHEW
ncbi:MAG: hypothetical protein LBK63_02105 [Treponema sp.]|jgi:hypothetical protein|nr:hypothetical protein [Treponema sp.]